MSCERNQPSSGPPLCANNCGFYGVPANKNLCSKCYREELQKQNILPAASSGSSSSAPSASTILAASGNVPLASFTPLGSGMQSSGSLEGNTLRVGSIIASPSDTTATETATTSETSPSPTEKSIITATTTTSTFNAPSSTAASSPVVMISSLSSSEVSSEPPIEEKEVVERPIQQNKGRCWSCNCKIGLIGFQCRCDYYFCGRHRYADAHDCPFDYKAYDRDRLSKQNVKVVADKLDRI